jgi:hypothetical protein
VVTARGTFPWDKFPGRETDHSPPSGAKPKDKRSCTSIHPYAFIVLGETGEEPVVEYKIRTVTVRIYCANSQKVPGSIPGRVTGDFFRGSLLFHVPGVDSAP